ncbi:MAG: DUF3169 family protein [Candidatus Niameybacter stercoravium]|nr:DUF3169 family protein [Candidatus Niameybacter stercoravium]
MKSYNWKKGILYFIICGFIGAVAGALLSRVVSDNNLPNIVNVLETLAPSLFIIALIIGLIGIGGYFYFSIQLKKDGYCNEEGSFYEKHEMAMSIAMMCSTLCAVINFTALGVNFFKPTLATVIFMLNVCIAFLGEVGHISLVKKVRPELNADPLNPKFHKHYFDQLDECERNQTGKASFDTLSAMTPLYVFLFITCYLLSVAFNISPVICLPIGIIWGVQTILMTYHANKKPRA